ncbi:unnamed protein product [Mucor hiemalis]
MCELLQDDILSDLVDTLPTEEEVDTLIAVEQGQAYQITVNRDPLPPIAIIVRQASTVLDIKKLVRRSVERMEKKNKSIKNRSISWKYIWKSHCLMFGSSRLLKDTDVVSQLGIKQNSVLKFSRLAHEKGHHRKAWRH